MEVFLAKAECVGEKVVLLVVLEYFFFFKQKTAYEMRISDWSSDVCSSDLHRLARETRALGGGRALHPRAALVRDAAPGKRDRAAQAERRARDRKSVV